ncbi:hypothetical protein BBOV_III007070 [Babesia bovis T2Bo]|uniref:hypothetical protein n=1 Tax=Babesia bovis T2Bo TaxID=484906 RepID=UPI001C34D90F|nr:hypothetical protein BBOV_III007070 [Babesia bovis T2Bo]EDO08268.2 hypothetical protein BBOV_III007070 [Babesia bovis T2Bo]
MKSQIKGAMRAKRILKNATVYWKGQKTPLLDIPFTGSFRYVRLPNDKLALELVRGAFLGFRRHAANRFIKALDQHGNNLFELSRVGYNANYYRNNIDSILQMYIERMQLDHLFALYQINLRCITANNEVKYLLIEAISQKIVNFMKEATSYDTIGNFLDNSKGIIRTREKRFKRHIANFIFQSHHDLVKSRAQVFDTTNISCGDSANVVEFKRKRLFVGDSGIDESVTNSSNSFTLDGQTVDNVPIYGNGAALGMAADTSIPSSLQCTITGYSSDYMEHDTFKMPLDIGKCLRGQNILHGPHMPSIDHETKSEDCFISTNVIALVFSHLLKVKYWHRGFPFHTWINQYFIHNANLYHPIFARLYISNVVSLFDKNAIPKEVDALCDLVKKDMANYLEKKLSTQEAVYIQLYGYLQETNFGITELVEMFSIVKRLSHITSFRMLYEYSVRALTDALLITPVDLTTINSITNICNRNDIIGGVESLLHVMEIKMMQNIHTATCLDICGMLQALYKHSLHSQDLVDAIADKLDTDDIDDINASTIALSIQTLGRMQATFRSNNFLHRISDMFVNNPQMFYDLSESQCSGILWGLYKLHFKHSRLLEVALRRYSSKDLGTPNVNSLVISLSALTRFDSFTNASVLVHIYQLILKNITNMTISTSQQLITCVTRMLENITLCGSDQNSYKRMQVISGKLISSTMKHVCERLMDQITTAQAGAMLNALFRSEQRTSEIIAPLIASITGTYRKNIDWQSSVHVPRKSIFAYNIMPPCPFDPEVCANKLEKLEVTHLVGMCEAIHGLDYWSPYSLHLMLQIQKQIKPQLHDMKATHILSSCISFVNWHFTDIQLEGPNDDNSNQHKKTKMDISKTVNSMVGHDIEKLREAFNSWFDDTQHSCLPGVDILQHFHMILMRSQWKEDFLLCCIESLHRHANFLSAASLPLRRLKMVYDMLRFNIYLNGNVGHKMKLPLYTNTFTATLSSFLILEHVAPIQASHIPMTMPYNLVEFLTELYNISRTESFHNFIYENGGGASGLTDGNEDEDDIGLEIANCDLVVKSGNEVPQIRPLLVDDSLDKMGADLSVSSYHGHQGSGAIIHVKDKYIYVDPVIGGFRTSLLILDAKRHYVPHLVETIYS